jgi:SAM-dependent methyltransferase
MSCFLEQAEALERQAAEGRVAYYAERLLVKGSTVGNLLDVGCGNGYGVLEWRRRGIPCFGVDRSLYRMARWASEHKDRRPLVVADAQQLPFADASFDAVVSSGMIEHVGVSETSSPYTVTAHPDRDERRAQVIRDLGRVARGGGAVFVDCPNGTFPIDFWHGNRLGAFRIHPVPDALLPTHGELLRWGKAAGCRAAIEPLHGRLRFRQISQRWWGKILSPAVAAFLRLLDLLVSARLGRLVAWLYPYIVVSLLPAEK